MNYIALLGVFSFFALYAQIKKEAFSSMSLDFSSPYYENGVFKTDQGGIIESEDFRLQAEEISYKKTENKHVVEAKKHILFQYKNQAYLAEKLTFDFEKKTGTLTNLITFVSPFYLESQEAFLQKNGSALVKGTQLTTSDTGNYHWQMSADTITIFPEKSLLDFEGVCIRFFSVPLWLPSFHLNMKQFSPSLLRYNLTWDKGSGPRLSARYRAYSWENLAIFLRGEYRLSTGFGGAIETEYQPSNKKDFLITKSYLASDVIPTNLQKDRRYRLQGLGKTFYNDLTFQISWDKYSDPLMPGDFTSQDFEINTEKSTYFSTNYFPEPLSIQALFVPRLNDFQTIYERLPRFSLRTRPFEWGNWLFTSEISTGYEKIAYADSLENLLEDRSSGKIHFQQTALYSKAFGPLNTSTKFLGYGTYYTKGLKEKNPFYGQLAYDFSLNSSGKKSFSNWIHVTTPYTNFQGYSPSTSSLDEHIIFSLEDGLDELHMWNIGWKNILFRENSLSRLSLDLFSRYFFSPEKAAKPPFRVHMNASLDFSKVFVQWINAYDLRRNSLDNTDLSIEWTFSENAALSFDFFYRSKYYFRKAIKERFFLENTRSFEELLSSPLSDKRATFLTKGFFRVTPFSSIKFELRKGFFRKDEPSYIEGKIEAKTLLVANCEFALSYEHTETDDRVRAGLEVLRY